MYLFRKVELRTFTFETSENRKYLLLRCMTEGERPVRDTLTERIWLGDVVVA